MRTILKSALIIGLLGGATVFGVLSKGDPEFAHLALIGPKSEELDQAFQNFEKDTGKSRNDMTYTDIYRYVQQVRK